MNSIWLNQERDYQADWAPGSLWHTSRNVREPPRNLLTVAEIWGTLRHSDTSLKLHRSQNTFRKSFCPSVHLEFSFVPICLKYCGLSIAAKTERGGGGDTVRSPEIPVPALTLLQGHRISFRLS